MEGPHPLPEPVAGRRCGRHPAQRITGVCSSCLVERLASVRSPAHPEIVEVASSSSPSYRHPDANPEIVEVASSSSPSYRHPDANPEIVEVASSSSPSYRHPDANPEIVEVASSSSPYRHPDNSSLPVPVPGDQDQGKLRKTLMLLFQMDDSVADSQGASRPPEAEDPDRASEADRPGGARGSRWKGASWLRAILPRRGARRRGTNKEEEEEEPSRPSGPVDPHPADVVGGGPSPLVVERRASFRRSCEWMVCREPPSTRGRSSSLDPPRHSWDGSMVGRAFACSFACLDDPPDGVTRVRQSNAEESARELYAAGVAADSMNGDRAAGVAPESRSGGHSADVGGEGPRFRERRSCSDAGPEITAVASGVRRRRSNRWSRVWDRSITSPLKEFVRKGEHALDRSFSESRRETRRCKNGETTDIENGEIQHGRSNGSVLPGRASQGSGRGSQAAAANGDAQNFRADWLKNKECRIGRSRSVHYTSPGNFGNGMLRFYLTPMRSNRTANRGRRRSSRLFGRGLFGFV